MSQEDRQVVAGEWVGFPGGELEGQRPQALCRSCRDLRARRGAVRGETARLLCFSCYRADLDRARALKAARDLNTASEERFQFQLPFERVDRARLAMLKVERAAARRQAQLDERRRAQLDAFARAAALPLPAAWRPFVVAG